MGYPIDLGYQTDDLNRLSLQAFFITSRGFAVWENTTLPVPYPTIVPVQPVSTVGAFDSHGALTLDRSAPGTIANLRVNEETVTWTNGSTTRSAMLS